MPWAQPSPSPFAFCNAVNFPITSIHRHYEDLSIAVPLGDPNSASPTCHALVSRCSPALPPFWQQHEHPCTFACSFWVLLVAAWAWCSQGRSSSEEEMCLLLTHSHTGDGGRVSAAQSSSVRAHWEPRQSFKYQSEELRVVNSGNYKRYQSILCMGG